MADHLLDDLIDTLAISLGKVRHACAQRHLERLQSRLGGSDSLVVRTLVDGTWREESVPIGELVRPSGLIASALEVQIACRVEEIPASDGGLPPLVLCPTDGPVEHLLSISIAGGSPIRGELYLDGHLLRPFEVKVPPSGGG